jgi:hypothetical protein
MKVSRRRGRLRLSLAPPEVEVLDDLLDQLAQVAGEGGDPDDPITRRLYPAAYPDDERSDAEYRELTEAGLRGERLERVEACRADLARGGDIELADPEAGRRWIQVLNDVRLALGTRLGITEDDDQGLDPDDPQHEPKLLYYWLTAMQDRVVQELMR